MKIDKKSRVWDPEEGSELLRRPKGNKEVEGLRLSWDHQRPYCFTYEGFENLSHLRFLEVNGGRFEDILAEARLLWHESPSIVIPTNMKSDLLPQLRWLSWHCFPPSFDISNFSMENVVILNLDDSEITDDWKGWSHMKVMKNLKALNLSDCHGLRKLPDELGVHLASLEYLSLRACASLEVLPDTIGNLKSLIWLDISETNVKKLPESIGMLRNLKGMKMPNSCLEKITDAFWTIEKLEEIKAVKGEDEVPFRVKIGDCIYKNQSLRILKLLRADIYELPRLPESLIKLKVGDLYMDTFPDLSNLTNLQVLELTFGSRYYSDGRFYGPVEDWTPWRIENLTKLESLSLFLNWEIGSETDLSPPLPLKAFRLPRLPSSLCSLRLNGFESLYSIGDLSNLKKLSSLKIEYSGVVEIQGLGCLENLRDLELQRLPQFQILPDLSNLNKLRSLCIGHCDNLLEIQGEPPRFLDKFKIYNCSSLRKLPDLSTVMGKTVVEVDDWSKVNVEAILGFARKNPQDLRLVGFEKLHIIPDLSNLRNSSELTSLHVQRCDDLVEIQGELPLSLEELVISSCESLQELPDLSSLEGLQKVVIEDCRKLNEEAIFGFTQRRPANVWESLYCLRLSNIGRVKILPDLSNSKKLRNLIVIRCGDLVEIQGELPESLEALQINSCKSLEKLPDLYNLKGLQKVFIDCEKLDGKAILGFARRSRPIFWDNLQYLWLDRLGHVKILPDLNSSNKLQSLILQNCGDLIEIQGKLPQSLKELKIVNCESLQKFPDLSSLKELQTVVIGDFKKLSVEAILDFARIRQGFFLENLQNLWLTSLGQVQILPDLSNLKKLRSLRLHKFGDLVEIQGELQESFEELQIFSCKYLQKLPDLSSLKKLQKVIIEDCKELNGEAILGFARENLQYLGLSSLGQIEILPDLSNSNKLRSLRLRNCGSLVEIQGKLPYSLEELHIFSCESLQKLHNLSHLKRLQKVEIEDCKKLNTDAIFGFLQRDRRIYWPNLQHLWFSGLVQVDKLPDLCRSEKLRSLRLRNCGDLVEIQGELPKTLEDLQLNSCESLTKLPNLSSLLGLRTLVLEDCKKLKGEAILNLDQENLRWLWLSGLGQVEILPSLSNLSKLRSLRLRNCSDLVEIQGELPQSLEDLQIHSCKSLQKLPDLSSLNGLQMVRITCCGKLKVEAISWLCSEKSVKFVGEDDESSSERGP